MALSIQSEGRRHYIVGNTYPIKDRLRSAGAKWDPERKAWWTGKREVAEQFVGGSVEVAHVDAPTTPDGGAGRDAPGEDGVVAGKATYKGKTYYLAGRVARGRTRWDDRVEAVTSRDGGRVLLYFRDGSRQFWAARADVEIVKVYDKPQTIGRLARFAADAKRGFPGRATCYMCGSPSCEGASGGLCEHD